MPVPVFMQGVGWTKGCVPGSETVEGGGGGGERGEGHPPWGRGGLPRMVRSGRGVEGVFRGF